MIHIHSSYASKKILLIKYNADSARHGCMIISCSFSRALRFSRIIPVKPEAIYTLLQKSRSILMPLTSSHPFPLLLCSLSCPFVLSHVAAWRFFFHLSRKDDLVISRVEPLNKKCCLPAVVLLPPASWIMSITYKCPPQ